MPVPVPLHGFLVEAFLTVILALRSHACRFGGVDILIHNAGITRDRTLAKMSDAQLTSVLSVNLRAIMRINEELGVYTPSRKPGMLDFNLDCCDMRIHFITVYSWVSLHCVSS